MRKHARIATFVAGAMLGCGSNGQDTPATSPPAPGVSTAETTSSSADGSDSNDGAPSEPTRRDAAAATGPKVPTKQSGTRLLVEIDKWGVRVSGKDWIKTQPAEIQKKHREVFKVQTLASFRRITPLQATGRTIGRRLYSPVMNRLAEMLTARASLESGPGPHAVELRIGKGVPFWLVAHFANLLMWDDRVSHLEYRQGNRDVVVARALNPAAEGTASCKQGHLLFKGSRALRYDLGAHHDGLSSAMVQDASEPALPPRCGPWNKVSPSLFAESTEKACRAWRVDAVDAETSFRDAMGPVAKHLPEGDVVLLGNAHRPADCPPR